MSKKIPEYLINVLPSFMKGKYQEPFYEDSTHDIWRLDNINNSGESGFLKVCRNTDTPFWQITADLFGLRLSEEIPKLDIIYQLLVENTKLEIPSIISLSQTSDKPAFLLSRAIQGNVINTHDTHLELVKGLARHLASVHNVTSNNWGKLREPKFECSEWSKQLERILKKQVAENDLLKTGKKVGGAATLLSRTAINNGIFNQIQASIDMCKQIQIDSFSPVMLDLRWDQFMQREGKLSALIDLDAFVFAPRELDFVILEYLLNKTQIIEFKKEYEKIRPIPNINAQREPYRLLLYFMQVLGSSDIEVWMNQEITL